MKFLVGITFCLFALGNVPIGGQPVPNERAQRFRDCVLADPAPGDRDDVARPSPAPEVLELYDRLARMSDPEQKVALREIPPETKSQLWTHNLRLFLERHPELSEVQRAIVNDGITLIVPLIFDPSCTDQCDTERKRLTQSHREGAQAFFSVELMNSAFLRLGEFPAVTPVRAAEIRLPSPDTKPTCDCASWYDCWWWGACLLVPCIRTPWGCGFYDDDPCGRYCA